MHSEYCENYNTGLCRSCDLISLTYNEQLKKKSNEVRQVITQFLNSSVTFLPIVAADKPMGSRFKAKLAIGGTVESPKLGFPNTKGEITDLVRCPLLDPLLNVIAATFRKLIREHRWQPYEIAAKSGELKYLLLQRSFNKKELIVRLILRSKELLASIEKTIPQLQSIHPEIKVISVNLQPKHAAIIEGDEEIVLTPEKFIEDRLADTTLFFHPQAFSQVTPFVAGELYRAASKILASRKIAHLLDLYCGVGAFGLSCAKSATEVLGVEVSKLATMAAERGALANEITNYRIVSERVEDFFSSLAGEKFNGIIVNPPRRGLGAALVQKIMAINPEVLIYSSCNPETLREDLVALSGIFRLLSVQPFDMFPMTEHVEILCELVRK